MRIAMLGPLDVLDDSGERCDVAGVRLRRLVIALALDAGRVVPTSRLVDAVWAEDLPTEPANALQALVSRLRRAVPGIAVAHHPAGWAWPNTSPARSPGLDGDLDAAREHMERANTIVLGTTVASQLQAVVSTGLGLVAGARGDLDEARRCHDDALAQVLSTRDAPVVAVVLVGYADLMVRADAADRAAFLLGASVGVRGTVDRSMPDVDRITADATAALGDTAFAEAYERGRAVTLDEVTVDIVTRSL